MPSSASIIAAILALTPLALSLPQQTVQTAQGINPINGLAVPAASTDAASQDTDSAPTVTALAQPSRSASSSNEDDDTATITPSASLPSPTDSSSPSDSSSEAESVNTDTNVIIWTDTAENTVYTVTRSTTSFIPVPTMQVPPNEGDVATATITGMDGKPTPTHDVDTFVQGYTGGSQKESEAKVWWLLGAAVAVGAMLL